MMMRILTALLALLIPAEALAQTTVPGGAFASTPITLTDGATISLPCPGIGGSGVYYLTLTGSNHQILFPTCPATSNGQTARFRINSGNTAGLPYTGLSFAPGFIWTGGSPYASCTAFSIPNPACLSAQVASQIDEFGCDVIGTTAPSTEWDCWVPQYAIAAPPVGPAYVTGALGPYVTSGTTSTVTLAATPGQSVLCEVIFGPQSTVSLSSVDDGGGTNLTLGDTQINGSARGQAAYEINVTGHSTSTITFHYSGSVTSGAQAVCDVISGATSVVAGGHAFTTQSNAGTGTDVITSGVISSAVGALVWGVTGSSAGFSSVAGTGFTQHEHDTTGTQFGFTTETKISAGATDAATFTFSSATGNNYTGALIVH